MASSRLEKIGTIYTRVKGLLKTNAMKYEDRPLWFDVYEKFPPNSEPRYDKPPPDYEVKSIFYEDDKIRALFHKNKKNPGVVNLLNNETQSKTTKFIDIYKKLMVTEPPEQLYDNAIQLLNHDLEKQAGGAQQTKDSFVDSFKDAQQNLGQKIDVSKIFKE